ncbi:unnamed protein product [Onchocerca ochengi]|uniref:Bax inhibitor 1 n=1 Tax=Onchocerca ochengi TaxID=42157 RepID=A0A182E711_ONCOC|nr:unnamed protein product [Onchocerca ochengi]
MDYRRQNMRHDNNIFGNIRNAFTSLNDKLEKDVQVHLRCVYGTLALGLIAATVGSCLHLFIDFFHYNFFLLFGSILLMVALLKTPHNVHNERKRFGYYIAFCILSGVSSGPIIEKALIIDPSVILTSFLGAAIIFGCFTMAALHAPTTKFLHLGGFITSGLLFIMITAIFSHSAFMRTTCLWLAFVINCTLILYDTQLICEKRRHGDTDYILHTIELFIDFIDLFRYILAILSQKKDAGGVY